MTETSAQPTLPNSLTRADFEAITEHCHEVASKIVAAGETVAPVLLAGKMADGAPDITRIIQVPTKTEQDKDCVAGLMQGLVAEPDIEFVVHIVGAWLLVSPPAWQHRQASAPQGSRPVQHPVQGLPDPHPQSAAPQTQPSGTRGTGFFTRLPGPLRAAAAGQELTQACCPALLWRRAVMRHSPLTKSCCSPSAGQIYKSGCVRAISQVSAAQVGIGV